MPKKDGTGPITNASIAGRGLGFCNINIKLLGSGYGCKRGHRWLASDPNFSKSEKELLEERKEILKNSLDQIDKRLEDL